MLAYCIIEQVGHLTISPQSYFAIRLVISQTLQAALNLENSNLDDALPYQSYPSPLARLVRSNLSEFILA
jgi:hypothetical protein